jgi:hypothetical protein
MPSAGILTIHSVYGRIVQFALFATCVAVFASASSAHASAFTVADYLADLNIVQDDIKQSPAIYDGSPTAMSDLLAAVNAGQAGILQAQGNISAPEPEFLTAIIDFNDVLAIMGDPLFDVDDASAVPEPPSLLLLGTAFPALVAVVWITQRQRRHLTAHRLPL